MILWPKRRRESLQPEPDRGGREVEVERRLAEAERRLRALQAETKVIRRGAA